MIDLNYYKLKYLLGSSKKKVPLVVSFLLLNSILEVFGIALIGNFLSLALNNRPVFNFKLLESVNSFVSSFDYFSLILMCIGFFLFKTVLLILSNIYIIKFNNNFQYDLSNRLIEAYKNNKFLDIIASKKSEILNIINNLTGIVGSTGIQAFINLLNHLILSFIILIFLGISQIKFLLIIVSFFIIFFICFQFIFRNKLKVIGKKLSDSSRDRLDNVNKFYEGFGELATLNKIYYFQKLIKITSYTMKKFQNYQNYIEIMPRILIELIFIIIGFLFLFFLKINNLSFIEYFPIITLFVLSFLRLLPSFVQILRNINDLNFSTHAVNKLYQLLSSKNKSKVSSKKLNFDKFKKIQLKKINFSYSKASQPLLKNISISIKKNDCIGIFGESGSGKTTFLNILCGLIEPTSGKIVINNHNVNKKMNKLDIQNILRNYFSLMRQQSFIVNDNITENIALSKFTGNIKKIKLIV